MTDRYTIFVNESDHPIMDEVATTLNKNLTLKFQVQHPRPAGHRMSRWTDEASTSAARNVAMNLIRNAGGKHSLKARRRAAAQDHDCLKALITGSAQ